MPGDTPTTVTALSDSSLRLPAEVLVHHIQTRRSIRRFENRPVPRDVIERLLEAARWAPSAHNRQPWRFVILTTESDRRLLAQSMAETLAADLRADGGDETVIAQDTGRSQARIAAAPVAIVVCLSMVDMDTYPDSHRQRFEHTMAVQSVAMASQNLLLAAHAEGLGACWLCGPLFCQDIVKETLALPSDFEPQGLIVLGYPAETRQKERATLNGKAIFR
jgi:F420 biosynthesis protein FbiB-like protein